MFVMLSSLCPKKEDEKLSPLQVARRRHRPWRKSYELDKIVFPVTTSQPADSPKSPKGTQSKLFVMLFYSCQKKEEEKTSTLEVARVGHRSWRLSNSLDKIESPVVTAQPVPGPKSPTTPSSRRCVMLLYSRQKEEGRKISPLEVARKLHRPRKKSSILDKIRPHVTSAQTAPDPKSPTTPSQ